MSSKPIDSPGAEQRFRQAFERLKTDTPINLKRGTPITQNNVARESGCDPSALRKSRFPVLIREIQAYVELHKAESTSRTQADRKQRNVRRSLQEHLNDVIRERDYAQSQILNANRRIIELSEQVQSLQRRLDELQAITTNIR